MFEALKKKRREKHAKVVTELAKSERRLQEAQDSYGKTVAKWGTLNQVTEDDRRKVQENLERQRRRLAAAQAELAGLGENNKKQAETERAERQAEIARLTEELDTLESQNADEKVESRKFEENISAGYAAQDREDSEIPNVDDDRPTVLVAADNPKYAAALEEMQRRHQQAAVEQVATLDSVDAEYYQQVWEHMQRGVFDILDPAHEGELHALPQFGKNIMVHALGLSPEDAARLGNEHLKEAQDYIAQALEDEALTDTQRATILKHHTQAFVEGVQRIAAEAPVSMGASSATTEPSGAELVGEGTILSKIIAGDLSVFESEGARLNAGDMRALTLRMLTEELGLDTETAEQLDAKHLAPLRTKRIEIWGNAKMDETDQALAYEQLDMEYAEALATIAHNTGTHKTETGAEVSADAAADDASFEAFIEKVGTPEGVEALRAEVQEADSAVAKVVADSAYVLSTAAQVALYEARKNALFEHLATLQTSGASVDVTVKQVWHAELQAFWKLVGEILGTHESQGNNDAAKEHVVAERLTNAASMGDAVNAVSEVAPQEPHVEVIRGSGDSGESIPKQSPDIEQAIFTELPSALEGVPLKERTGTSAQLAEAKKECAAIAAQYEDALRMHYSGNLVTRNAKKAGRFVRSLRNAGPETFTGDLGNLEKKYIQARQTYVQTLERALEERRDRKVQKGADTNAVFSDRRTVKRTGDGDAAHRALFSGEGLRAAAANKFVLEVAKRRQEIRLEAEQPIPAVRKTMAFLRKHRWEARAGVVVVTGLLGAATGGVLAGLVAGSARGARIGAGLLAGGAVGALYNEGMRAQQQTNEETKQFVQKAFQPGMDIGFYDKGIKAGEFKEERIRNWRNTLAVAAGGATSIGTGMATAGETAAETTTPPSRPEAPSTGPNVQSDVPESYVLTSEQESSASPKFQSDETPKPTFDMSSDRVTPKPTLNTAQQADAGSEPSHASVDESESHPTKGLEQGVLSEEQVSGSATSNAVPAATSVADVSEATAPHETLAMQHTIESGDTLWELMEPRLEQQSTAFANLSEAEQRQMLTALFNHIDNSKQLRDVVGMRSDYADIIHTGETLDLSAMQADLESYIKTGAWKYAEDIKVFDGSDVSMATVQDHTVPIEELKRYGFTQDRSNEWHMDADAQRKGLIEWVEGPQRAGIFGMAPTVYERLHEMPMHQLMHQPDAELDKDYNVSAVEWHTWHTAVDKMKTVLPPDPQESLGSYMDRYLEVQEANHLAASTQSVEGQPELGETIVRNTVQALHNSLSAESTGTALWSQWEAMQMDAIKGGNALDTLQSNEQFSHIFAGQLTKVMAPLDNENFAEYLQRFYASGYRIHTSEGVRIDRNGLFTGDIIVVSRDGVHTYGIANKQGTD